METGYEPDLPASHGSNPDFQALPEAAVSQPVSQPHAADHRQKSSASLFLVIDIKFLHSPSYPLSKLIIKSASSDFLFIEPAAASRTSDKFHASPVRASCPSPGVHPRPALRMTLSASFWAFSISWRPSSRALARAASSTPLFLSYLFHPGRLRISLSPPAASLHFASSYFFLNGCIPFIDHFVDRL